MNFLVDNINVLKGAFYLKSICIKTNDLKLEKYLLDNLKDIDIKGIML